MVHKKNPFKAINVVFLSQLFGHCLIISIFCLSLAIGAFAQTDFSNSENQELDAETIQLLKTSKSARKDYVHRLEMESGRQNNSGTFAPNFLNSENFSGDTTGNGLDPAFTNVTLEDAYTRVERIAVQADGKIVVGGSFSLVNGVSRPRLIRLNANGTLDTSFNTGNTGPNDSVFSIDILPDGKILIGGFFTAYNGVSRNFIARLNSDGSLDTSFDPGVGPNGSVNDVIVLPDSRLLIVGLFSAYNGVAARVVRLNSNGTQDTTFTPPTISNTVRKIALQQDGKIIIGGFFNNVGGLTRTGVARLNADGTHDTTFDPTTNTTTATCSLAIQPDGKILVGTAYAGATVNKIIVRLNSNGSLDGTFTSAYPLNFESSLHDMIIQPDGKILAAGFFNTGGGPALGGIQIGLGVVRFNTDGSFDFTFSQQALDMTNNPFPEVFSIAQTPGGQIVAGGDFYKYSTSTISKRIAFLNANGTVDNSYNVLIEAEGNIQTTVRQPDGKIIIGGNFLRVNGVNRSNLARLNADGTLDPSFNPGFDGTIFALALQLDGKILVGGQFGTVNGFDINAASGLILMEALTAHLLRRWTLMRHLFSASQFSRTERF